MVATGAASHKLLDELRDELPQAAVGRAPLACGGVRGVTPVLDGGGPQRSACAWTLRLACASTVSSLRRP